MPFGNRCALGCRWPVLFRDVAAQQSSLDRWRSMDRAGFELACMSSKKTEEPKNRGKTRIETPLEVMNGHVDVFVPKLIQALVNHGLGYGAAMQRS